MFLLPAPRASAQIEVVECSGKHYIVRFSRNDLQDIVDVVHRHAGEVHRVVVDDGTQARKNEQCWRLLGVLLALIVGPGILGGSLTAYMHAEDGENVKEGFSIFGMVVGSIVIILGFGVIFTHMKYYWWGPGPTYRTVNDWPGMGDLETKLISEKVKVESIVRKIREGMSLDGALGADESRALLSGSGHLTAANFDSFPGYYLLTYSPANSIGSVFNTELITDYSAPTAISRNKFAYHIMNIGRRLRQNGIKVVSRYYLTRVGDRFVPFSSGDIMSELDSVKVVVDAGGDEDPDASPYL